MSSARKRRAEIQANPPAPNKMVPPPVPGRGSVASPPQVGANGMTLQQIINITDRRLTALESTVQKGGVAAPAGAAAPLAQETVDEIYSRFDILLAEVAELKDTVMKLQTYTMDVNRVLFEERKKGSENDEPEPEPEPEADTEPEPEAEADESAPKRGGAAGRRVRGGGLRVNL